MNYIIVPANFLVETSLSRLYTNTINGFDTPRQQNAGRVQVVKKIFVASPRQRIVLVKAQTRSSAKQYETRIAYEDIEFLDAEEAGGQTHTFTALDGQEYTIEPMKYNNSDVRVSCTCLDFYYRFSVWNGDDDSLLGNPPTPYIKKSDNREPVNPNKIPGLCKHLISLTNELRQERFIA